MSGKALITLLILGSSSAAFARPMGEGRFQRGNVARDHRGGEGQRGFERGRGGGAPIVRGRIGIDPGRVRVDHDRDRGWDRDRGRDRDDYRRWDRDDARWDRRRVIVQPTPVYAPSYGSWTYGGYDGYAGYAAPSGVMLASPFTLDGDGIQYLDGGNASFTSLRLSTSGGDTYVNQVLVLYADGDRQVIAVNQELQAGNPVVDLALDRRDPVARVVLYGHSEYGGLISVAGF